jgi:hypothetical protein
MKRLLSVFFTVVIIGASFNAKAQIPFVQVYFDKHGTSDTRFCPPEVTPDTLSVYAVNFNMWMSSIEYKINYGPAINHVDDIFEIRGTINGNSAWGLKKSFRDPVDASVPVRVQRAVVVWFCTDCAGFLDTPVEVVPHPDNVKVRAVRWPDDVFIEGVGMSSTICPWATPSRESTWGQVKSLYIK